MLKNTCSIGIMAFNEADNIAFLLKDLLDQRIDNFTMAEIIVVVSGCEDETLPAVRKAMEKDSRIELITQTQRKGKASAINLFLTRAKGDFIVLISADVRLNEDVLKKVLSPLLNPEIGLTGGRPCPVNAPDTFMGYSGNLLWKLHHQMSLRKPKLGELVAFRNSVDMIPETTAVDEATLEAIFLKKGLSLCYVPDAVIYNKSPETVRDFLRQRERVFIGHLWLWKNYHYGVASFDYWLLIKLIVKNL